MILVFGGTTEGRRAIKALEEAGKPYWYSTKTGEQEVVMQHGRRTDGALDKEAMTRFCKENGIRLIVDAAHPFARVLHATIARVADELQLPAIRFERIYPPRDTDIIWIDDYSELPSHLSPSSTLLATTGVQSIARLKPLENEGIRIFYRILDRDSSIQLALRQGAGAEQLCYYEDAREIPVRADAILLKESGESGGFSKKVEAARAKGMKIIALRRPTLPPSFHVVNGEYGLRRMVERLLPDFYPLKSGLTTGTCATAAAIAAVLQFLQCKGAATSSLFTHHSSLPKEVPVRLPNGETIFVPVHYADGYAYVLKESGDDPDVTNGIEVRATAYPHPCPPSHAPQTLTPDLRLPKEGAYSSCTKALSLGEGWGEVYAGEGIGRFTLPGFDYPPGEAAVNRVPREMLRDNLQALLESNQTPLPWGGDGGGLSIVLSIPEGEAIARRTFNPRLGIEGGISIIGVSGIVMPYSEEAFIDSIRKCMTVAQASGSPRIVIGSGMKSQEQLRRLYPDLPPQAFVEYGNYIGETLKMAHELGITRVTLGIMIGKAVKLAQGHLDTHSRRVTMDKNFVAQLLREANCPLSIVNYQLPKITVARELWDILSPPEAQRLSDVIIAHCRRHCVPLLPNGELTFLLLRNEE